MDNKENIDAIEDLFDGISINNESDSIIIDNDDASLIDSMVEGIGSIRTNEEMSKIKKDNDEIKVRSEEEVDYISDLFDRIDPRKKFDDDSFMERIMKKYSDNEKEKVRIEYSAKNMKKEYNKKIDDWMEQSKKSIVKDNKYFYEVLIEFAKERLKGKKKKSVSLPSGTIKFSSSNSVNIKDEEALILAITDLVNNKDNCSYMEDSISVKKSIVKLEVKKIIEKNKEDESKLMISDKDVTNFVSLDTKENDSIKII